MAGARSVVAAPPVVGTLTAMSARRRRVTIALALFGWLVLTVPNASAAVEGPCTATFNGVDVDRIDTISSPLELGAEDTLVFQGIDEQGTRQAGVEVAIMMVIVDSEEVIYGPLEGEFRADLDLGASSPYAVGLFRIRGTTDNCTAEAWLRVSGRIPLATLVGLAAAGVTIGGATAAIGAIASRRRFSPLTATVAGIACNTAHAPEIFENVVRHLSRAGRRIRILHLIDETVDAIREAHGAGTRVGILSTMGSYRVGLYREAAAAGGLQPVEPTPEVQESVVHRSVYDPTFGVKAQPTRVSDEARALADAAVRHLAERGAEIVVLGCTELPSVLPDATCHGLPVIDPATVLARALLRATYPAKLRPEPAVAG